VRFRLLGPVQIEVGGRILATGRRRERALLAILLLEQGRVVPADRLCELLWDGDPPESARRNLQSHVARLRGLLAALDDPSGVRLTGAPAGYALNVAADDVDAHRFRTLVTRARATAELPERARLLSDALQLWRGPALQDAASPGCGPASAPTWTTCTSRRRRTCYRCGSTSVSTPSWYPT
jgi:DNA-binding SARP family transcriptional activator